MRWTLLACLALSISACRSTARCPDGQVFNESGDCVAETTCPAGRDPETGRCRGVEMDAGPVTDMDAGFDAAPTPIDSCVPRGAETCDNVDDDCDGRVDEMATCDLANATARCEAGACIVTGCVTGFLDCTSEPGCETPRDRQNCSACADQCAPLEGCGAMGCAPPTIDWTLRGDIPQQLAAGTGGYVYGVFTDEAALDYTWSVSAVGDAAPGMTQPADLDPLVDILDLDAAFAPRIAVRLRSVGADINGVSYGGSGDASSDAFVGPPAIRFGGSGEQQVAAIAESSLVRVGFGSFDTELRINGGSPITGDPSCNLFVWIRRGGADQVYPFPCDSVATSPDCITGDVGSATVNEKCIYASLALSGDSAIAFLGTNLDGTLDYRGERVSNAGHQPVIIAFRTTDGTPLWSLALPDGGGEESRVPISADGDRLYVGLAERLLTLDAATGTELNSLAIPVTAVDASGGLVATLGSSASAVLIDGQTVAPGGILAVHRATGEFVHGLRIEGGGTGGLAIDSFGGVMVSPSFSGVIRVAGNSYSSSEGGALFHLNPAP